jgi:hypothetical protein
LRNPGSSYNAVYSFTVKPGSDYGWITAFSPTDNFLLGYIWKRNHYPWIHLWQHYNENKLQYRGLEFGTAGLHQPYHVLLDVATTLFGEKTYAYIDAGESVTKNYFSFCHSTGKGFTGVENVHVTNKEIIVTARNESGNINIKLTEQLFGINKNK